MLGYITNVRGWVGWWALVLIAVSIALAEFLGGIIIIAVVATGLSLLFPGEELEGLREQVPQRVLGEVITEDVICGMEGRSVPPLQAASWSF